MNISRNNIFNSWEVDCAYCIAFHHSNALVCQLSNDVMTKIGRGQIEIYKQIHTKRQDPNIVVANHEISKLIWQSN